MPPGLSPQGEPWSPSHASHPQLIGSGELQPDLPLSPGGWESTLSGLRKMHVDVGQSLEASTAGEKHATKFIADLSDDRARIAVTKADVVEAIEELQLMMAAAELHRSAGSEASR